MGIGFTPGVERKLFTATNSFANPVLLKDTPAKLSPRSGKLARFA
jgi:hypothetical protein